MNDVLISCVGKWISVKLDHSRFGPGAAGSLAHVLRLLSHDAALIRPHAFGDGHALGHTFDGGSSAGHFDMDEERGGGQAGAVCLQ